MEYLSTTYGLVTNQDPKSENGQLFLAQLILLKQIRGQNIDPETVCLFMQILNSSVEDGLYHRNPDLTERTMSHDNLSGIFSWSYIRDNRFRHKIWNYLLKHLGTYDNTKGKSKQLSRFLPFNPSNFFIWGLCANSNIYLMFLPFYLVNLVISSNKPSNDTSGKILNWVELYPHKHHWLCKYFWKYFANKMTKMYGENWIVRIFDIYHGGNSKEFPINKLLGIGV